MADRSGPLYTEALRVGQIYSSPILQAPETVRGVHIEVELTGSDLVLEHFSGHLSLPVLSLRLTYSVALAARQPVGTGRAQIRCIVPKQKSGQISR